MKVSIMKAVSILFLSLLLLGCTNKQVYNAVQDAQVLECQQYPDTRYDRCMEELSVPYEEYERDRRALEDE
jgi:hypothetical protein